MREENKSCWGMMGGIRTLSVTPSEWLRLIFSFSLIGKASTNIIL
jgi:hypothetical protein